MIGKFCSAQIPANPSQGYILSTGPLLISRSFICPNGSDDFEVSLSKKRILALLQVVSELAAAATRSMAAGKSVSTEDCNIMQWICRICENVNEGSASDFATRGDGIGGRDG
jgi:hypothetical protein